MVGPKHSQLIDRELCLKQDDVSGVQCNTFNIFTFDPFIGLNVRAILALLCIGPFKPTQRRERNIKF